jgi:hypothetical protein
MHGVEYAKASAYVQYKRRIHSERTYHVKSVCSPSIPTIGLDHVSVLRYAASKRHMLVPAPPPTHFVSLPTPSRSFLSLSSPLANLANYWYPYYCTLTLPNLFAPLSRHHLRSPIQEPYVVYMALMT